MARYNGHIKENVAPYVASKIGIYNSDGDRVGEIPLGNFKPNYGERLYRFGIMSDIHYNDRDDDNIIADDGSNYHYDLICALKYFEQKEDVDFVCTSGDISTNYIEQVKIYHDMVSEYCPNTMIFTCKGNHDNMASFENDELWKQYTYPSNNPYTTYFFDSTDPYNIECEDCDSSNSFYFIKPMSGNPDKKDIFVFLSVDYGLNKATSNLVRYYHPDSISWLRTIFREYSDCRIFLFTHLFFWKKAGNCNEYYYPGNHDDYYVLTGSQYNILNQLNNQFKNVIWFTGHSHYKWEYQQYDVLGTNGNKRRCNICNYDPDSNEYCAYNVHIPSLARPILNTLQYAVDYESAQCGVVDVYEDYIVVRGIDMTNSKTDYTYSTKYIPIAQYKLPVTINGEYNADMSEYMEVSEPETTKTYNVTNEFTISDLDNMEEGDTNLVSITFVGTDTGNIGCDSCNWIWSSIGGTDIFPNKGTGITAEQASEQEITLKTVVQGNVTDYPWKYIFRLTKVNDGFTLSSYNGQFTMCVSTDNILYWSKDNKNACIFTFTNPTDTTSTSLVVGQNTNQKLLRINTNELIFNYGSKGPKLTTEKGGWSVIYMYSINNN